MNILSTFLLAWITAGPAQAEPAADQAGPSPAEIHVSHIMKSMNGPPDRVGLLEILDAETAVAVQHAELMASNLEDLEAMKTHARHVGHAVDPSTQEKGPGKGFGLEKAAAWIEKKMTLATRSEGATDGMSTHGVHISASAHDVVDWCTEVLAEVQKVSDAETAEVAAASATRIQELVTWIRDGVDANGDGKVSWEAGEGGVAQVRQHLEILTGAS